MDRFLFDVVSLFFCCARPLPYLNDRRSLFLATKLVQLRTWLENTAVERKNLLACLFCFFLLLCLLAKCHTLQKPAVNSEENDKSVANKNGDECCDTEASGMYVKCTVWCLHSLRNCAVCWKSVCASFFFFFFFFFFGLVCFVVFFVCLFVSW